jgi:hypothetical protein
MSLPDESELRACLDYFRERGLDDLAESFVRFVGAERAARHSEFFGVNVAAIAYGLMNRAHWAPPEVREEFVNPAAYILGRIANATDLGHYGTTLACVPVSVLTSEWGWNRVEIPAEVRGDRRPYTVICPVCIGSTLRRGLRPDRQARPYVATVVMEPAPIGIGSPRLDGPRIVLYLGHCRHCKRWLIG